MTQVEAGRLLFFTRFWPWVVLTWKHLWSEPLLPLYAAAKPLHAKALVHSKDTQSAPVSWHAAPERGIPGEVVSVLG